MYHYRESGLDNVWLVNGYTVENDEEFGELVFIEDTDGLHKAIAWEIINEPRRISGAEFKFLRTVLDLTQREVAVLLASNEQSVAKWEKARNKPVVNRTADKLFRSVAALRLGNRDVALMALDAAPAAQEVEVRIDLQINGDNWSPRLAA